MRFRTLFVHAETFARRGRSPLALSMRVLGQALAWAVVGPLTLSACTSPQGTAATSKTVFSAKQEAGDGFFIPKGSFAKPKEVSHLVTAATLPALNSRQTPQALNNSVVIYSSPSTINYLARGGLDAKSSTRTWEAFLKKYNVPYTVATTLLQLQGDRSRVLILPSSIALSAQERQGVIDFRARGGGVLASWLCGVRDEQGNWSGFGFMEEALDVKVVGDTAADQSDNFLMPNGDTPISNHLPAGRRIWLERAKNWYPLRLLGRNSGAHIMDWSRNFSADKETTTITFDERALSEQFGSRSVVLGYPERLWQSADPEHLEAIAHNALTWLMRLPSAYKAAWPAPFSSALMIAVDANEVVAESDLVFAKQLEGVGARATYYTLTEHLAKSANSLKVLQSRGHEIAFMADAFVGFKNQSAAIQSTRLDKMRKRMLDAGLIIDGPPGFRPPFESYDKITEDTLVREGFGHYIATMEASESRLPHVLALATKASGDNLATVVMPRTQRGPEDATEEGDVDEGLRSFFGELALAGKMGGLSVVRLPTQSLLPSEEWAKVAENMKTLQDSMWMSTASKIAKWWRERERVQVTLEGPNSDSTELTIEVKGKGALHEPILALINLPREHTGISLTPINQTSEFIKVVGIDRWRAGVVMTDLPEGRHRWKIEFAYQP